MAKGVEKRIREQYPTLAFLFDDPEVGRLLRDAVNPNKGYSPTTFRAKLMQTKWWRRHSESWRQWQVLRQTDPKEAGRLRRDWSAQLRQITSQLGIKFSRNEVKWITEAGLQNGQSPDSQRTLNGLMRFIEAHPGHLAKAGAIRTTRRDLRELTRSQWLVNPNDERINDWALRIAFGKKTIEDYNAAKAAQAVQRFPHMRSMIAQGATVGEIVAPNIAVWAQEMDTTPDQVLARMRKRGNWQRQLLGIRDPKTGKRRLPTEFEAMQLAREMPSWWDTSSGRQADAEMAQGLLTAFGKRAG